MLFTIEQFLLNRYPDRHFNVWMFEKVPEGYWKDINNQRTFLNFVAQKYSITHPKDWSNMTAQTLASEGGTGLLKYYNGNLSKGKYHHIVLETLLQYCSTQSKIVQQSLQYNILYHETLLKLFSFSNCVS
jgi:hypothetical protein